MVDRLFLFVLVVTAPKNSANEPADASENSSDAFTCFRNALAQRVGKAEAVKRTVGRRCRTCNECFFEHGWA